MKKYLILAFAVSLHVNSQAQTDADALRFSQSSITGTARFTSMGGAFGALGGDFSSIGVNPAGLGIFRKSEFTFSNSFYLNQTTTDFLGNTSVENKFNFNIPNFGFVFTHLTKADKKELEGWKSISVGIGLNRTNNFHARSFFEALNPNNSLLNHFVETANSSNDPLDPFYEQLAYDAGLIYPINDSTDELTSDVGYPGTYPITQRRSSTTRGAMSEWNFSLGANYNNFLYLGGSIGIASFRFSEESIYSEEDKGNVIPVLNEYSLEQDVSTSGTGINIKLGAIVRPVDWMRLGLAFHSPTVASLKDDYQNTVKSDLENIPTSPAQSPEGSFDYTFATPLKAVGSIAFIIAKSGLISADYEFVDYSGARFDASGSIYSEVNEAIRTKYNAAGNIRVGGEYKLDAVSFRGGWAYYSSPISSKDRISGADFSKQYITGGIGIREKNFFIDLGYAYGVSKEYFQPYSLGNAYPNEVVSGSKNKVVSHNFTATFGVKF